MNEGVGTKFEAYYPELLEMWVHIRVRPTRDGIVLFFQNITEVKRAQAAMIQAEKLAAVGRLSASIAHEINNPLESVTNLLYLARRSESHDETQAYLDAAERELRRVSLSAARLCASTSSPPTRSRRPARIFSAASSTCTKAA